MTLTIGEINENEILAYLGYRGGELQRELIQSIYTAWERVKMCAEPRVIYRIIDASLDGEIGGFIRSEDICRRLSGCRRAVVFGATLGASVDRELMRLRVIDIKQALIFDACASAAIESAVNGFCSGFSEKYNYVGERFSPGYGDLPLDGQMQIDKLLGLSSIGITLTDGALMLPQKSVTAIFGIGEIKDEK